MDAVVVVVRAAVVLVLVLVIVLMTRAVAETLARAAIVVPRHPF